MRFEVVDVDGRRVVEVMDPETLFLEANQAFVAADYALAAQKYGLILDRFGGARFEVASRYNAGLSYARMGRFEMALPYFEAVVQATQGSKDAQDALFQMASCHEGEASWPATIGVLDRVLAPEYAEISVVDRIEARARRGYARQRSGDLALAERDYLAGIRLYRTNMDVPAIGRSYHVSMSHFQIGEIYRELFEGVRFSLPVEQMRRDLKEKSNYFLQAQRAFLRALRLSHRDFATRAGYQLGALYEVMFDHMLNAEVPPDLSEAEKAIYFEELQGHVRPLVVQAVEIYERNLRMGERMGRRDEWLGRTKASLDRLRVVIKAQDDEEAGSVSPAPEAP
jgi:tetratricopeptide (TPR) repeat protein